MASDFVWIDPEREMKALAEADARRRRIANMSQTVTPEMADRAVSLIQRHPNLSAGLLQALVAGQVPDEQADLLAQEDDGGFFGSVFDVAGDVIETVASGADWALDKAYEYGIKPAIRGAFTVADTLAEEVVQRPLTAALSAVTEDRGVDVSRIPQAYREYGDSAGLNILQGDVQPDAEEGVLGKGFFAGGAAAVEADRERTLQIRGRRADIGQALANGLVGDFYSPGDKAYDITAGISGFAVDVGLDPLALVTMGATSAVRASRTLQASEAIDVARAVGAVDGARRNTVLVEKARNFFGSERLLQRLADADGYTIAQSWSRSPANRLDIDTIRRLGDATDQAQVAEVLFDAVAHGDITRKGFYSGTGNFIKRNLVTSESKALAPFRYFTPEGKLAGIAPRGVVSADDVGEATGKVDSLLRQANVDREVRAGIFDRMTRITPGRFDELFDVVTDAIDEVGKKVGDTADTALNDVAREFRNQLEDFRAFGTDSWGDALDVPYAKRKIVQNFDGEQVEVVVPTPQITSELNSMALTLPDVTDIRRAATESRVLRTVYTSKGWDFGAGAMRSLTRNLFKPLAILRPAYIVRIGAEEQARLGAAHFDSIFSHPFRFIQANVRNRDELTDFLGGNLVDVARANDVITKDAHGVLADKYASQSRIFKIARREEGRGLTDDFLRGWRGELGQLSAAPEARKLAELRGNIDEFKVWAQGDGLQHIQRIAKVNDEAASLLRFGDEFDQWADTLRRRLEAKTAGWDEDIVAKVVDGDIPFAGATRKARTEEANFARFLQSKASQNRAPAAVKVEQLGDNHVRIMNRAVDALFDHITGKPTSYLARFPAFRQSMIRRTSELMDSLADDTLRGEAMRRADDALKLTKKERRLLADSAVKSRGVAGPIDSIETLNTAVVSKSADDVKDLLFDVTRRSAAQDAMEVVVPFLDAWKEVSLTWMRLMKENPAFFIRAQAGYRELREQGHFYANDFGDEVFQYPGGGFLSSFVDRLNEGGGGLGAAAAAIPGAIADTATGNTPDYGVALEGRVQGLNLVAQGVGPGFGPVVQWGAGLFTSPDLDKVREFIAPFGTGLDEPGEITDPGTIAEGLMPAWMRKFMNSFRQGDIDERQWNSTVGDAIKTLASSGDYDPADQGKLKEDAERFGFWLLVARGFVQFAGPTGPQATLQVEADTDPTLEDWNPDIDPDGRMFSVGVLAQEYYRLLRTYGPDLANEKFYGMYGLEPFFIAQGKTRSIKELPVDAEGNRWIRRNEDLVDAYPTVVGYFSPTDEDAELDFSVYAAQIERGDRQSLTPEQQLGLATQVKARAMYQAVKDRVAELPTAQREQVLEMTKARLETLYPGWQTPVLGVGESARVEDKIRDLQRAANDPRLADSRVTTPLQAYLNLRDAMLAQANQRGLKTLKSEKVADLRRQLEVGGSALQRAFPEFAGIWTEVLSRELQG